MSSSRRIHYQRFYPMCDQFVGYNVACACLLEYLNQFKPGWTFYSPVYSRILIQIELNLDPNPPIEGYGF